MAMAVAMTMCVSVNHGSSRTRDAQPTNTSPVGRTRTHTKVVLDVICMIVKVAIWARIKGLFYFGWQKSSMSLDAAVINPKFTSEWSEDLCRDRIVVKLNRVPTPVADSVME